MIRLRVARRVYLVGFMGAGKTRVGRELARRLQVELFDTDQWIEDRACRTVAEIFSLEGEAAFRETERQAHAAASRRPRVVVATGGGAVIDARNRELMGSTGRVVWLKCPFAILVDRLQAERHARPLASRADLAELHAQRVPMYAFAHHQVDASLDPGEVAQVIERLLDGSEARP
jgi:shikimate kinase